MTAVAPFFDPSTTDFGTDVAVLTDLDPVWGLARNEFNYILQAARRITQRPGGHDFYADFCDPPYQCLDIRSRLNAKMSKPDVARLKGEIVAVEENDVRTRSCAADVTFDFDTNTLTIELALETNDGPFTLVMKASTVTVALLSVNGVSTASLPPIASSAPVTIVVTGGTVSAAPGPPGPAGPTTRSFTLADCEDSSGAEVAQPQDQIELNLGTLGASITIELVGIFMSGAGTATFHVRMNGSDNAADGTIVATLTATSPSFTAKNGSSTIANPGGLGRFIVTVASSGASVAAQGRNMTLTVG